MSVLVKNGEIMTADERYVADLFCEDETITRIGRDLPAPNDAEVIDATGSMFSPASSTRMCTFTSLSWARSRRTRTSRAALVGGTTTFIEMICPGCAEKPLEAFESSSAKRAARAPATSAFTWA